MKATKVYIMVCALCTASIAGNLVSSVVSAAQAPSVRITQTIQNQTTNSEPRDADDANTALTVKKGDVLKYTITLKNSSEVNDANKNDFLFAKLIDALPSGIELIGDANTREVNEDLGTIQPGKAATKQYIVTVTADKNGDVIENKACYTGRFASKDQAQSDCGSAFIKVQGATTDGQPETPTTPPPTTPSTGENTQPPAPQEKSVENPKTETNPTNALPTTGPSDSIAPLAAMSVGALTYATHAVVTRRRG
jgi:uncharacterized repeat protein (TIGR01451 family)